jgi:hypothetical protein
MPAWPTMATITNSLRQRLKRSLRVAYRGPSARSSEYRWVGATARALWVVPRGALRDPVLAGHRHLA